MAQSPWTRRAQSGTLPPSAHGAAAYRNIRDVMTHAEHLDLLHEQYAEGIASVRIAADGGTIRTVADLQAALRREGR